MPNLLKVLTKINLKCLNKNIYIELKYSTH